MRSEWEKGTRVWGVDRSARGGGGGSEEGAEGKGVSRCRGAAGVEDVRRWERTKTPCVE